MNEETLFAEALAKSPEERSAFLDEACAGDTELRERVEQLLKVHEEPGSFHRAVALVHVWRFHQKLPENHF